MYDRKCKYLAMVFMPLPTFLNQMVQLNLNGDFGYYQLKSSHD